MHLEAGELRDFLPEFVHHLLKTGAEVVLEHGYGSGMSIREEDYLLDSYSPRFASMEEAYQQDIVIVLRYPGDSIVEKMRPGACLVSMLHIPTRPSRAAFLRSLGLEGISLDSIKDDTGRRLVENLQAVAWNGVEVAFRVLTSIFPPPGIDSPLRPPLRVTLMGAGAVGMQAGQAAIRYGDMLTWKRLADAGVPGIILTVVEYDMTGNRPIMQEILRGTDLLIDATQRPDPSRPVIPNEWIGLMAPHAVLLDLSVDPYDCNTEQPIQKGIEGVPHGNLDQYIFAPDDPAFDQLPDCINTHNRRFSVSCYSWPGIYPLKCMDLYGKQLAPILRTLIESGGPAFIHPERTYFHRAIARAMLSRF